MTNFVEKAPTLESLWRAIILFGQNTASYKFAFGRVLLSFAQTPGTVIPLEELALPYARELARHLQFADRQTTTPKSQFLDACRAFNQGELEEADLIAATMKTGFRYVLDAFHAVNYSDIPIRFFEQTSTNRVKGIVLTDELFRLMEGTQGDNLPHEIEARWRLVEKAWELGLSRHLLAIEAVDEGAMLIVRDNDLRRVDVTSSRSALNGYQKGKCFYCFADIKLDNYDLTDVDHFFPHALKQTGAMPLVNGVWNLVLACQRCNRGVEGKFARVPAIHYLERLHTRNEFFVSSHHPLRETILLQTGISESQRRQFLQQCHHEATQKLITGWRAPFELEPAF